MLKLKANIPQTSASRVIQWQETIQTLMCSEVRNAARAHHHSKIRPDPTLRIEKGEKHFNAFAYSDISETR